MPGKQEGIVLFITMVMLLLLSVTAMLMLGTAMAGQTTMQVYVRHNEAMQAAESILAATLREIGSVVMVSGVDYGLNASMLAGGSYTVRCLESYQEGFSPLDNETFDPHESCGEVVWQLDDNNNIAAISVDGNRSSTVQAISGSNGLSIVRRREDLSSGMGDLWEVYEVIALGSMQNAEQLLVQQFSVLAGFSGELENKQGEDSGATGGLENYFRLENWRNVR